jgi:hypothetical protein
MIHKSTDGGEPGASDDLRHDDWPLEGYEGDDAAQFVGFTSPPDSAGPGSAVFYDESTDSIIHATVDEKQQRLKPTTDYDQEISPEAESFTRSNVAEGADHDLEFTGAFTYRAPDDQVFVVERTFEVTVDDSDDPREASVDVTEVVLRSDAPASDRREGDAAILREERTSFGVDVDAETLDRGAQNAIKDTCQQWHESRPAPFA